MEWLREFWIDQREGIVAGALLLFTGQLIALCTWLLRNWYMQRGGVDYEIGHWSHPYEYVIRGRWASDGKTAILDPPRYMNASIPLTIRNRSRMPLNMSLDSVEFCREIPGPYKTEVVDGEKTQTRVIPAPLATMGFAMIGDGDAKIGAINVPARGSIRVRIIATATNPTIQTRPFYEWKVVWLEFKNADGKECPLTLWVSPQERKLDPNIEPYFPIPDHYFRCQGGDERYRPQGLRFS